MNEDNFNTTSVLIKLNVAKELMDKVEFQYNFCSY